MSEIDEEIQKLTEGLPNRLNMDVAIEIFKRAITLLERLKKKGYSMEDLFAWAFDKLGFANPRELVAKLELGTDELFKSVGLAAPGIYKHALEERTYRVVIYGEKGKLEDREIKASDIEVKEKISEILNKYRDVLTGYEIWELKEGIRMEVEGNDR